MADETKKTEPAMRPLTRLEIEARIGQGMGMDTFWEVASGVMQDVVETKKPGSVTLKLDFRLLDGNLMVGVKETISQNPPKQGDLQASFWVQDGKVYGRDPRQPDLGLAVVGNTIVDTKEGEVRLDLDDDDIRLDDGEDDDIRKES